MKIFITAILLVLLPSEDWIDDINARMETLRSEAKITKEKTVSNEEWVIEISKHKLKNERLMLFDGHDSAASPSSFKQKMYLKKNKICANLIVKIFPHFNREGSMKEGPEFIIVEENSYFKNGNEGIEFYREIEFSAGENIDSLKQELQKLEFEQKPLSSRDYITFVIDRRKMMGI